MNSVIETKQNENNNNKWNWKREAKNKQKNKSTITKDVNVCVCALYADEAFRTWKLLFEQREMSAIKEHTPKSVVWHKKVHTTPIAQLNWHSVYCVCWPGWLSNASTTSHTTHTCAQFALHIVLIRAPILHVLFKCALTDQMCVLTVFMFIRRYEWPTIRIPASTQFYVFLFSSLALSPSFFLSRNENKTLCPIAKYAKLPLAKDV